MKEPWCIATNTTDMPARALINLYARRWGIECALRDTKDSRFGMGMDSVHVSSPEGLALVTEAKRRGVDVSAETCPHYLLLNEAEMERQGAVAICAPPLRDELRRRQMWEAWRGGEVDTIGSDHSVMILLVSV